MTTAHNLHSTLARQQAKQRELAQHQPRPSRVRFAVKTQGTGESRLIGKQALTFGAYMLDEPTFSYGLVAVGSLKTGELPQGTATVLRWIKNSAGLYTGAEVGFKIASIKENITLKFSLTFEGITVRSTEGTGTETTTAPRGTNDYTGTAGQSTGVSA